MEKNVVFFSFFLLFFLSVKQDAKASVLQIVRDTSAIDTLEISSGESMINLNNSETYRELEILEVKSISVLTMSFLIFLLTLFTFFVTETLINSITHSYIIHFFNRYWINIVYSGTIF
jgi:hypothetical protein